MLKSWIEQWIPGAAKAQEISFEFAPPFTIPLAVLLLLIVAAVAGAFWWFRLKRLPRARRGTLIALRIAALVLVIFMLLDPTFSLRHVVPGEDYVVLLFDDSRSMRIRGNDGATRAERLQRAYEAARPAFEDKLRGAHHLAAYGFGKSINRLENPAALKFDQTESDPAGAVANALRDLAGARVAGIVLFSDGARQPIDKQLASEPGSDAKVPVFSVGVESETQWRDLELKNVSVARTNFDKSPVALTAHVTAEGLKGRQAVVEALERDRIVASTPLEITEDKLDSNIRMEFVPTTKGWVECLARVRLLDVDASTADRIVENNERGFIVDNREHSYRILYLSGRPNWQNKFIRRALEDDPALNLSSLIRVSGPNPSISFKARGDSNALFEGFNENEVHAPRYDEAVFVRLNVKESELADGYPQKAEDLFPYDLVIWGDIEADYFARRQMELTRDYVAKRGGSFLFLGGPRAFTEGHYADSIVEDMLPVALRSTPDDRESLTQFFRVRPTIEGMLTGVWTLDPDPKANEQLWNRLPPLYGVNLFPLLRAGATQQARTAADTESVDGQPFLVSQPYGLGRSAVLATGETWQWKMQNEEDDETHGRFWRQLVRSLVSEVPGQVVLKPGSENQTVGEPSKLEFLVRDRLFDKREGLQTSIQVSATGQKTADLPAEESIADLGVYSGEFTPEAPGMQVVKVSATNEKKEVVASHEQALLASPDFREYQNARYDPDYLKSIAKVSGGKFFSLDQLAEIPAQIPRSKVNDDIIDAYHLWQFPGLYLLLAAVFCAEWYLRRKQGQP